MAGAGQCKALGSRSHVLPSQRDPSPALIWAPWDRDLCNVGPQLWASCPTQQVRRAWWCCSCWLCLSPHSWLCSSWCWCSRDGTAALSSPVQVLHPQGIGKAQHVPVPPPAKSPSSTQPRPGSKGSVSLLCQHLELKREKIVISVKPWECGCPTNKQKLCFCTERPF